MTPHAILATTDPDAANALSPLVVMVLVICVLGIGVIFLIYTRLRIEQRNARQGSPRERINEIKSRAAEEGQSSKSKVELLELSTRLAAQLDNKAARLEQLIEQADARIEGLRALKAGSEAASNGRAASSRVEGHSTARLDDSSRGESDAELHAEIHRLADQGFSPVEIAQRLDEQTGKVELILALRQ